MTQAFYNPCRATTAAAMLIAWSGFLFAGVDVDAQPRSVSSASKAVGAQNPAAPAQVIDKGLTNPLIPGKVSFLEQVNHFVTGFDDDDVPLPVPSIDPAGVSYDSFLASLIVADSEIPEVAPAFSQVGATLFAIPTDGRLTLAQWDLTQITGVEPGSNQESTGVVSCDADGYTYVTNDDTDLLYRYAFDGENYSVVDFVSTRPQTFDPEGVTCDPANGLIYVVGGIDVNLVVYSYDQDEFEFVEEIDLNDGGAAPVQLVDAEGVTFDATSGNLFVVSDPAETIVEYDPAGRFVAAYSLSGLVPSPIAPQGITVAPSSMDPQRTSFYIVDGGLDNDQVPSERDGAVYELLIHRVQGEASGISRSQQPAAVRTVVKRDRANRKLQRVRPPIPDR